MGSKPSHTTETENVKQEIIHKIEAEYGVDAKVDVDVLVEFIVKVGKKVRVEEIHRE